MIFCLASFSDDIMAIQPGSSVIIFSLANVLNSDCLSAVTQLPEIDQDIRLATDRSLRSIRCSSWPKTLGLSETRLIIDLIGPPDFGRKYIASSWFVAGPVRLRVLLR
jgi:hypothetical protein